MLLTKIFSKKWGCLKEAIKTVPDEEMGSCLGSEGNGVSGGEGGAERPSRKGEK